MAIKTQFVDTDRDALTNAAAVTLTPPSGSWDWLNSKPHALTPEEQRVLRAETRADISARDPSLAKCSFESIDAMRSLARSRVERGIAAPPRVRNAAPATATRPKAAPSREPTITEIIADAQRTIAMVQPLINAHVVGTTAPASRSELDARLDEAFGIASGTTLPDAPRSPVQSFGEPVRFTVPNEPPSRSREEADQRARLDAQFGLTSSAPPPKPPLTREQILRAAAAA